MTALSVVSCLFVLSGLLSALVIALDLTHRPQSMRIMYSVWILTGLWAGLPGLWAYFRFGRGTRHKRSTGGETDPAAGTDGMEGMEGVEGMEGMGKAEGMTGMAGMAGRMTDPAKMADGSNPAAKTKSVPGRDRSMPDAGLAGHASASRPANETMGMAMPHRPRWQSVVLSTLHCGAGCTLADLIGEWALFLFPVAVAGSRLAGSWTIDYVLALILGVWFQYAAIRSMRRISRRKALLDALKADFLSLTAWQVGMYAWMAFVLFVLRDGAMLPRTSWSFWFMMQLAMYCGFLFSLPMNVLLIDKHIKHAM